MYLSYYGLEREPFHVTPDPGFLFGSAAHREAYAALVYGTQQRKGFLLLTGEVGVGKTTVLRAFLAHVDQANTKAIYLFDPSLNFEEIVDTLLRELGAAGNGRRTRPLVEKMRRLHWALIQEYRNGMNVVFLIDEAHHLQEQTLERLRMLSNLETDREKLLQIVLAGQPELETMLDRPSLRQFKQRIAVWARLKPLTRLESLDYLRHRVRRAGGTLETTFTAKAVRRIVRNAKGIPRTINIVCDNALISGFGSQRRPVTPDLVREAIDDLQGRRKWRIRRVPVLLTAASIAAMLITVAMLLWAPSLHAETRYTASGTAELSAPSPVYAFERAIPSRAPVSPVAAPNPVSVNPNHEDAALTAMNRLGVERKPTETPAPIPTKGDETSALGGTAPAPPETKSEPEAPSVPSVDEKKTDSKTGSAAESFEDVVRVVREGESLSHVATAFYGSADKRLLEAIIQRNPGLRNPNMIREGDVLILPASVTVSPANANAAPRKPATPRGNSHE